MRLLRDSHSLPLLRWHQIGLALICVCLCATASLGDDKDKTAKDAKAMQALAAPHPAAAAGKEVDNKQKKDAETKQAAAAARAAEVKAKKEKAAKRKAVAAPAAAAVRVIAPANAANQHEALMQQFQAQFRPILSAELSFIRHVCEVPKEKRPKVKAAGEAGLKDAAKQYADLQQGRRNGVTAANAQQGYPPEIIHEALAAALKEALAPEEFARYADEWAERAESRKRAAVLAFVSRLDGTLFLTAEQREEIAAAIAANWQDKWEQWLVVNYADQYFPMIPDKAVLPHLNDQQKSVWKGLQKVEYGVAGGGAAIEENDGYWGDNPDGAAAPPVNGVLFIGNAIVAPN